MDAAVETARVPLSPACALSESVQCEGIALSGRTSRKIECPKRLFQTPPASRFVYAPPRRGLQQRSLLSLCAIGDERSTNSGSNGFMSWRYTILLRSRTFDEIGLLASNAAKSKQRPSLNRRDVLMRAWAATPAQLSAAGLLRSPAEPRARQCERWPRSVLATVMCPTRHSLLRKMSVATTASGPCSWLARW
ncbi:hypothetical protein ABIB66_008698 [Bradyrhizobium sp. F1.13.3]